MAHIEVIERQFLSEIRAKIEKNTAKFLQNFFVKNLTFSSFAAHLLMYWKFWFDTGHYALNHRKMDVVRPTSKEIKINKVFNSKDKVKQIWKFNKMAIDDAKF